MAPCMLDHRPVFMRGISSKAQLSSEEQKETVIDILGSICIHLCDKCAKGYFPPKIDIQTRISGVPHINQNFTLISNLHTVFYLVAYF
jgi:hypothetical protein